MNRNYPVSVGGSVGTAEKDSVTDSTKRSAPAKAMKTAILAVAILSAAGSAFYFSTAAHAAKGTVPVAGQASKSNTLSNTRQTALSLPLFFEPNQGQTAPQVKFLAHGAGYGLFLTADEAVLKLQRPATNARTEANADRRAGSVIRMHLDGANSLARVSGASPLPGKSNYFIGNNAAKWHQNIPQFARVQYKAVYPGVDLVYYGNQGQLEYDFQVGPGADPSQIALSFSGASARIDGAATSSSAGDLILSTNNGDIRFRAPHIYQHSESGKGDEVVAGAFRQLADNKIGFMVGAYDHSRELVIDPTLSYSSYLGGTVAGSGSETNVRVAVDSAGMVYVAGSTDSADFPATDGSTLKTGATNIFIAKINPLLIGTPSLIFAQYLGGTGTDSLAGVAVDSSGNIYVAGSTTSVDFPPSDNAFQKAPESAAQHGFLSRLSPDLNSTYKLSYSTYLSGTGTDTVTGLAIDTNQDAYVTGDTTSTDASSNYFPANPNGFQIQSNYATGGTQFFASKINTNGSGQFSMLYSTYFGGGYPAGATAVGGGIAVDTAGSAPNMYITGTTNMPAPLGPNGEHGFPIVNAQSQLGCLNACITSTNTDAFVAKINPNLPGSNPVYSTYLGGSGVDTGVAVAVDSSANAYVTGLTNSLNWPCTSCVAGYQTAFGGGTTDAYIAKVGNIVGSSYNMTYFTYIGGSGDETGAAIVVDSVQAAHITGWTDSPTGTFPVTTDAPQPTFNGGQSDAFAGSISTTLSGMGAGDFLTYLGGSGTDPLGTDQGTGVAIDNIGNTYVVGTTTSADFPVKPNGYSTTLSGPQDAFITKISSVSGLTLTTPTTSPSPNPVAAGTQVEFTFTITNTGPDVANLVVFNATGLPTSGLASTPTAKVSSGSGSCGTVQGSIISCNIPTLAVNAVATVAVDLTPAVPIAVPNPLSISGNVSANGGTPVSVAQPGVNVVDFAITASPAAQTINAGDTATFQIIFTPSSNHGYNATITPSETTSPSIVTSTTPTFNPTTITLSGSGQASTVLSIPTLARPVNTGSLLRRGSFYAAWMPIGGLTLAGLGIGIGRKRRRWVIGAVLMLIAGTIVLQSACGSSSSTNTTSGGTQAGTYIVTVSGSAGSAASHTYQMTLTVN